MAEAAPAVMNASVDGDAATSTPLTIGG